MKNTRLIVKALKCKFVKSSNLFSGERVLTCKGIWYGQGYYPPYDCDICPIFSETIRGKTIEEFKEGKLEEK